MVHPLVRSKNDCGTRQSGRSNGITQDLSPRSADTIEFDGGHDEITAGAY
jgi:hypothetical protein